MRPRRGKQDSQTLARRRPHLLTFNKGLIDQIHRILQASMLKTVWCRISSFAGAKCNGPQTRHRKREIHRAGLHRSTLVFRDRGKNNKTWGQKNLIQGGSWSLGRFFSHFRSGPRHSRGGGGGGSWKKGHNLFALHQIIRRSGWKSNRRGRISCS